MKRALALSLSSNCMRRARMLVAALAALPLIASAAPVWTASTWTWGEFTPVANNLIAGINTTGNIAILTDGVLEKGNTYAQYTGNGASYKWELPEPANVREVRIFTTWSDIGRVDISINSIIATLEGGTTATLSPGAHSNTLRAPSGYPFSSLKDSTGALLAQKVTAITVNFGTQQNGGVGYGEIEVVGTATNLNFVTVSSSGAECDTPLLGSFSGYGDFSVPRNQQITATVPLSGSSDTMKWTLEGWTLTETDAAGTVTTTQNGTANTNNCTFMPAEGCCYNLKWQWNVEYKIAVTADAGLSVSASVPYALHGDTVTISVTDDTAPFLVWEGDVSDTDKFATSFTITADGPKTFHAKAPAAIYYVAPGGTGNGTSWADAFGTIHEAVAAAGSATDGALVCVKEGAFLQTNAVAATGVGPLMIRGGYAGDGFTAGDATVVGRQTKDAGGNLIQCPLFSFSGSTVALESLTITNGFSRSSTYGQAVSLLSTCTASIKDCIFTENGPGGHDDAGYFGGAVGAQQGTLVIDNCTFARNKLDGYGGNNGNVCPRGGAVGAYRAAVTIRHSTFDRNWTRSVHARGYGGGAIGLKECPVVVIDNCTFTTNFARTSDGASNYLPADQWGHGPYGGTIYIADSPSAVIRDSTFLGGWSASFGTGRLTWGWGGLMFFFNSNVALTRTTVYGAGESGYTSGGIYNWAWGSIDIQGGSLHMTNVLHGASYSGWLLGNNGGTIEAVNCTLAGARQHGSTLRATTAYVQRDGSATFKNCIFWDNAEGDMLIVGGTAPAFTYCITETLQPGIGNSTDDPLFGDSVYFHPKSAAGRYSGGWFDGGAWATTDTATSASIDAGAPADGFGAEPQPNLRRINLGYDGGTAVASKSVMGTDPVPSEDTLGIYAYEATAITANGATVSADVASTGGGANPTVTVAWGPEDKGATLTDWPNKLELGTFAPWNPASYTITNASAPTEVFYRFFATNAVGTAASDPVKSFMAASLPTIVYDTDENPVSHRYRTSARLHATLASDGGAPTTVHVVWWPTAEPADVTTNAANYGLAIDSGSAVAVDLTGLAPGTAYSYFIEAVNGAGATTLATKSFSTVAESAPLGLYVGAAAAGLGDGSSAANASADYQDVINAATHAGDEIRVLAGTLTIDAELLVSGHPGLAIRGGYTDDTTRSGRSVIQRDTAKILNHRLFNVSASTITFDSLEINHGRVISTTSFYGQGICLYAACNTTITNCIFRNNGRDVDSIADVNCYGGAIGAQDGTLRVYDSLFEGNAVQGGGNNIRGLGGAIGMTGTSGSSADIRRCSFTANFTQAVHSRDFGGGALGFHSVPEINIEGCTFNTNFCRQASGGNSHTGQPYPHGGTIYVYNSANTTISDCAILGSWSSQYQTALYYGFGGTMWLQSSTVAMNRVVIYGAGYNGYSTSTAVGNYVSGSIDVYGGSLYMTNVLHGAAYSGPILCNLANGKIEAVNCTFAGARGMRAKPGFAYVQIMGSATFRNCILWNNAGGDFQYVDGPQPIFDYCITETERPGTGNLASDPLFFDSIHFHPLSRAGRYDGGWFDGGAWVTTDAATSASIDAGDPAMGYGAEPQPNLRRINMGYDGGTAVASKSDCGTDPVVTDDKLMVYAYAATTVTENSATVSADVASTGGGSNPNVTVVWGDSDKGTNSVAAWGANAVSLGTYAPWQLASYTISNASALDEVFYRFLVENEKGVSWSDPVRSFKIGRKPTISYPAEDDIVTHLYRTYARVNVNLVSLGGSDTAVRFIYWPVADPGAVVTNLANDSLALPVGSYALPAANLAENTEYAYFVEAENVVGVTRLAQRTFKTRKDADKLTLIGGPANVGHGDGASFAHPSGELQMLLDALYMGGDELLLMDGTNIVYDPLVITSHPGLTIRGGYTAGGADRSGWSCIRRDTSLPKKHRIIDVSASTITFEQIEIADGYHVTSATAYGQGLALRNACTTVITNCVFNNNGVDGGNNTDHNYYGGAVGAENGTLTVVDSVFNNNRLWGGGGNIKPRGGAIGANGSTVTVLRSAFNRNCTQTVHSRWGGGGALGFDSSTVVIDQCRFTTNYARTSGGDSWHGGTKTGPYGGTFHFNGTVATVTDCSVVGSWLSNGMDGGMYYDVGGTIYATGAAGDVTVKRTSFLDCGNTGYVNCNKYSHGVICIGGGKLSLQNVLVGVSFTGLQLACRGGTLEALNCTFTGGRGLAVNRSQQAFLLTDGTASLRNCIFWDNAGGSIHVEGSATPTVTYTDLQTDIGTEDIQYLSADNHVFSADPLFEDAAALDYRLGKGSPCINAGNPAGITRAETDLDGAKRISGASIDLGAYERQQNGLIMVLR